MTLQGSLSKHTLFTKWGVIVIAASIFIPTGCKKEESIQKYTVTHHKPTIGDSGADDRGKARLLAVMVPTKEKQSWFFKLGPSPLVTPELAAQFDQFMASVKIDGDDFQNPKTITWSLPEGWQTGPPRKGRYATIFVTADKKLDLSITFAGGNELDNVNRWRVQQLGIEKITAEQLDEYAPRLMIDGRPARRVDYLGSVMAGGKMPAMR